MSPEEKDWLERWIAQRRAAHPVWVFWATMIPATVVVLGYLYLFVAVVKGD